MESTKETGCQAPEGPILCVNNCGFFGSAATMNMCSKCHKDIILKQHQAKLAAQSIDNIVNGSSSSSTSKVLVFAEAVKVETVELNVASPQQQADLASDPNSEAKANSGSNRCATCRKRVGLTGFNCRCGHLFCSVHRYSDKHDCQFDYRATGRDAIAKANPVVKSEKLDKI